jgi:hypothetical protein
VYSGRCKVRATTQLAATYAYTPPIWAQGMNTLMLMLQMYVCQKDACQAPR